MKRLCVLFCLMAMILSTVSISALAAEPEEKVIDLGDNYYMVETITQYPISRSGNIIGGTKTGVIRYGSTEIGSITLTATFDISGSSAIAIGADIRASERNGGKCIDKNASCSGNKATGWATFSYNGGDKSTSLTISCSPDGTVS